MSLPPDSPYFSAFNGDIRNVKLFAPAGIRHDAANSTYTFSVQPDWYLNPLDHYHVLDFNNGTGSPQNMTLTLPVQQKLPHGSRFYVVHYKTIKANDTIQLYTIANSDETINGAASPFTIGPFLTDVDPGIVFLFALNNNWSVYLQPYTTKANHTPMVRFNNANVDYSEQHNEASRSVYVDVGWGMTPPGTQYPDTVVDAVVPDFGGGVVNSIVPGMDGFITLADYVDACSPPNTIPAFLCNKTGFYRINPNIQSRYRFLQDSNVIDETYSPIECWFTQGDINRNTTQQTTWDNNAKYKLPLTTTAVRSSNLMDGINVADIFGNATSSFVTELIEGQYYYFVYQMLHLDAVTVTLNNVTMFGNVVFEFLKETAPAAPPAVMSFNGGGEVNNNSSFFRGKTLERKQSHASVSSSSSSSTNQFHNFSPLQKQFSLKDLEGLVGQLYQREKSCQVEKEHLFNLQKEKEEALRKQKQEVLAQKEKEKSAILENKRIRRNHQLEIDVMMTTALPPCAAGLATISSSKGKGSK